MGSENTSSLIGRTDQFEEMNAQKISVNGLERQSGSDSFVVDIERFSSSHLCSDKDRNANSRFTLQRSLSRKGSPTQQGLEKKPNFVTNNERDHASLAISPRAGSLLQDGDTPEKPMVVVVGTIDHHHSGHNRQVLNPITVMTAAATVAETPMTTRRFSFKRSSALPWSFDPKKILFFFATLSSIGTIILICCTLCMNKLNGDENGLI